MIVSVLWLILTVPWVGLQCLIVVIPGHTHFFVDNVTIQNFGVCYCCQQGKRYFLSLELFLPNIWNALSIMSHII